MNKTDVNILRNAVVALKILALSSDDTFLEDLAERAENIVNGIDTEQVSKYQAAIVIALRHLNSCDGSESSDVYDEIVSLVHIEI